jgi:tetratricopeptide (TPR) repeat protein
MSRMGRAMSGEGGLVLISGEAGSGKTTLCEEFERLAAKSGCAVLIGRSIPGAQSPYLPFMEAFSDQTPNPFLKGDQASNSNEARLLLSVLDCLEQLSRERTLILRLEDLHWADSASIALVHFLARNTRVLKVLILGTYRPEDLHPFPSGEPHPLKECLRTMRREGMCQELEAELLGPDDTKKIVPLKLGGRVEESLLDLVARESRGNPLFAVEMLRFLLTSEQASFDDGIWRLHLKKGIQTPSTVREVILARTAHLPKQAKKILESASVVGERFEPRLIEESLGVHSDRLLEALEMMEKEYNLIKEEQDVYVFSHEKVRQVIYDEISTLRRKDLHQKIGQALERRLPNDELFAQLSWHFNEADDNERCIRYSLCAGKYCYRRKAIREAKSYFLVVLGRTEEDQEHVRERLEALESLGDLKNDASNLKEWYSYYDRFLELNKDRAARARVLVKTAECLDQAGLAETIRAFELLDEAEAISDDNLEVLANVEYRRADLCSNDGRVDDALDHIARARHLFDELGDPIGILRCGELQVIVLRQAYRLKEAKELAETQLQLAREREDPERVVMIELLASFICAMAGETAPAKTYASEAIELAGKLGMMWYWRLALHKRACALELEGDVESAEKDVSKALGNAIELENLFHAAMCEIDLGLYESELGHQDDAENHYEAALERVSAFDSWPRALLESDLSTLRAELLARIGAFDQSDETYERTINRNRELEHPYEMMNTRARYGMALARRGSLSKAQECFDEAMELAKRMGCEARIKMLAKRACVAV